MSYNESDESECQGFIPNKLIIKQQEHAYIKDYSPSLQFEPRYIMGDIVIKKQPPQSYYVSTDNQTYTHQHFTKNQSEINNILPTVSEVYLTKDYQCVYSRFKKPFANSKEPFSNDVIIKTLSRLQQFRILKNWKSQYFTARSSQKLKFDSKFEGGNLLCAFRSLIQIDTYVLFMQNDTNTYGYNQWFYFSIRQAKPNKKYTFRIANFKKRYSFFEKGMQPYIFSLQENKMKKCGWYKDGSQFKYYKSNFSQRQQDCYYTLQFQLQFRHQNDFVLICPCPPYSYSKLILHLNKYQAQATQNQLSFQVQSISKTLGGNQVPYVKISKLSEDLIKKKIIVITARQHSGQIWSSYLVDEIIKEISAQKHPFYKWIIDNFDFHIFPMVNVDGVVYGNFRCDLGGYDLNRCWKNPNPILQPHIYKIRAQIQNLTETFQIQFFLDLHTHSKDHGFFAYCCAQSIQGRKFPQILSQLTPLFRYPACTFGIQNYKNTTVRSQVFSWTKNVNTITIELSAFGYKHPLSKVLQPFTMSNINAIGQALISAIYYYQSHQTSYAKIQAHITQTVFTKRNDLLDDHELTIEGSDSDPEIDQIDQSIKLKKIFKQFKSDIKIKRKIHKLKKQKFNLSTTSQFNQMQSIQFSPTNRYRALTQTKQKEIVQSHMRETKQVTSTNFETRKIANSFNKMLKLTKLHNVPNRYNQSIEENSTKLQKIKQSKPLNLIQFSLKKLPIFPIQKLSNHFIFQVPNLNANPTPSLAINNKIPSQDKLIQKKVATFYRSKAQPKQLKKEKVNQSNNQPFKFLCVISQTKKRQQIQKIKQRRQKQNQSHLVSKLKLNAIRQSTVLQRYMKQKKQSKVDNIAKIWLNNFNRYSKSLEEQD